MEFITSIHGTVAIKLSGDDVKPKKDFMARDLVDFLGDVYQFSIKPNLIGTPIESLPGFFFQSGFMEKDSQKFPIKQISIIMNGDTVTAATTEDADIILEDFMAKLDDKFGYRFHSTKFQKVYQSNIVVKFDKGVEEKIEAISKIETILNKQIKRPEMPFKIKRLAFGYGNTEIQPPATIESLENSDFIMERRATEPYSENRYFCAAPTTTSELIKIVEQINKELL